MGLASRHVVQTLINYHRLLARHLHSFDVRNDSTENEDLHPDQHIPAFWKDKPRQHLLWSWLAVSAA